ncbi:hypothetical protein DYB25_000169 [Aphanomyces astaci]|uniref:Uncharacterized protein n=1 Tax=Aphanomyces astaci TaxID=112090 RepID=A0A397E0H3_APHAT|nr:hypothetical protein DYB36_000143 [Aphanomyces astaci]RHY14991.1 hypothetical protein DYB25_000169 [Aphanomyces astaci]RHY36013.1 hypothetical protein DYB34_000051 [Aphanomyces astaci]RHY65365.1 hypothetical protein DYB30_000435 [Aphanomyces astaci]RHY73774.1 hypothetical protein DYB38_003188 [Aphanomyces astaci]
MSSFSNLDLQPIAKCAAAATSAATFLAYVHQIHRDKLKDKKHSSIWIGDPSLPYFKLHAWSDDCTVVGRRLQAGDIVCFQDIAIRCFRGNNEAHLTSHSMYTVLVRQNQFQDVSSQHLYVPFTSIMPVVEWIKELHAKGVGFGQHGSVSTVTLKDLRENMLAHVVCRLRPLLRHDPFQSTTTSTSDDDPKFSAQLRQLVMVDGPDDGMILNVWHDHFDVRTIAFHTLVEVRHVVITFNTLRHSLMANTTGESSLAPFAHSPCANPHDAAPALLPPLVTCDSFAEAADSHVHGRLVVRDVIVESLELSFPSPSLSSCWQVGLLVEGYCAWCECSLPEQPTEVVPRLYGPCVNRCQGTKTMRWRYRPAFLHIRDRLGHRMRLRVPDAAMQTLVGHIPAAAVADKHAMHTPLLMTVNDVRDTVRMLLQALVDDPEHELDIQVYSHFVGGDVGFTRDSAYSFVALHA